MKIIISDKIARIIKNKKKLEKLLEVKITNRGKEVKIEGEAEEEYIAEKVIDALNFGFSFTNSILIKTEDFVFEILNIKDFTKRSDLKRIRARIIGKGGLTLNILHQVTNCNFELKNNQVGIICLPEHLENAQEAVISIIKGSKQSNVYKHLGKHSRQPVGDLGLKR